MNSNNSCGVETPRLSRETTLCTSGAKQSSALFPEIENSWTPNPFSDYFTQNREKLTGYAYSKIKRDGVNWQDAEDVVSLLPVDIAAGHFDKLLRPEELQRPFWVLSPPNQKKVAGCVYYRLDQHIATFFRRNGAQKRDFKCNLSYEQMLPSTLEKLRLLKDYSPSPYVLIQKEEKLTSMRQVLEKIDDVYAHLDPRDRAILDAMRRIPLNRRINARAIYEAMTDEERMLFVDHTQIPVVTDEETIIRAVYRRLRKLGLRIQALLKKRN